MVYMAVASHVVNKSCLPQGLKISQSILVNIPEGKLFASIFPRSVHEGYLVAMIFKVNEWYLRYLYEVKRAVRGVK